MGYIGPKLWVILWDILVKSYWMYLAKSGIYWAIGYIKQKLWDILGKRRDILEKKLWDILWDIFVKSYGIYLTKNEWHIG